MLGDSMAIEKISNKSNVIDMTARRQAQVKADKADNKNARPHDFKGQGNGSGKAVVQDISEIRQEILENERRVNRRTILSNFMGAFVVVPDVGLQPVTLYDISEGGAAFDTPTDAGRFTPGEEYAIRVYLSRDSYFPFVVQVKNVRELPMESVYRHGGVFVKSENNEDALRSFIKFIESISVVLKKDSGDILISTHRG